MFRISALNRTLEKATPSRAKAQQEFTEAAEIERQKALDEWYRDGGLIAIAWMKSYYRTHLGRPIKWNETWIVPFLLILFHPWIEEVAVNKAAQMGFSEFLVAFCGFTLTKLRSSLGLGFESRDKVNLMMGQRVQRAFSYCEPIQELGNSLRKLTNSEDIDSRQTITVGGVSLNTFYSKVDDDQTSSGMRSFPASAILIDEFGLCKPGTEKVAAPRMEASDWQVKPFVRLGSTPGLEGGTVDKKIRIAKYSFQWEVTCPYCETTQFLDPFGNFLRWTEIEEDGVIEDRVVDKMGLPLNWFHHSINPPGVQDWQLTDAAKEEAISTAYIGCQDCRAELEWDTLQAGHFRCKNTRELLTDFNERLLLERKPLRGTVAIDLPKLASKSFNAVQRIAFMFNTERPAQGIQEFLGRAISLGGGKISLKRIEACVGLPLLIPESRKPDLVVIGSDQGRYSNWYVVGDVYLAEGKEKKDRWRNARIKVREWGEFVGFNYLDTLVETYNVDLIGIDSEPEYNSIVEYGLKHLPRGQIPQKSEHYSEQGDLLYKAELFDNQTRRLFEGYLKKYGWEILDSKEGASPCVSYILKRPMGFGPGIAEINQQFPALRTTVATPSELEGFWQSVRPPSRHQVYLCDQMYLEGEQFRRTLRQVGNPGKKVRKAEQKERLVPIYLIDRTFGLDAVRDRIYRQLLHLPSGTTYNPEDKANFIYHLVTSDRLPDGKWVEPPGAPDHYHHALSFLEMAVLCNLYEPGMQRAAYGGIPQEDFYGK